MYSVFDVLVHIISVRRGMFDMFLQSIILIRVKAKRKLTGLEQKISYIRFIYLFF